MLIYVVSSDRNLLASPAFRTWSTARRKAPVTCQDTAVSSQRFRNPDLSALYTQNAHNSLILRAHTAYPHAQITGNAATVQARADAERPDKSRLILCETYAPKIRVDLEMRYGSMQTTNSKRTAAVDRSWKEYKSR